MVDRKWIAIVHLLYPEAKARQNGVYDGERWIGCNWRNAAEHLLQEEGYPIDKLDEVRRALG